MERIRLTKKEVTKRFPISISTLDRWRRTGRIATYKTQENGRTYFYEDEVAALFKKS